MKKQSKGQQVKTFKHWIPQRDGTSVETIGKVYFEADNGQFCLYFPEHITEVMEGLGVYKNRGTYSGSPLLDPRRGTVRSREMDKVIDAYTSLLKDYEQSIKLLRGEKVIRVEFKRNLPWRQDRPHVFSGAGATGGADISFCGQPAIFLNYDVLWKVDDGLYYREQHEAYGDRPAYETMRYKERIGKGTHLIPWTQEREDFIDGIRTKLIDLGWLLSDFLNDFEANINHAIATGSGLLALAPPPAQEDHQHEEVTPGAEHTGPTLDLAVSRAEAMEPKAYIPCGGCGADRPSQRCINCLHNFGGDSWNTAEVYKPRVRERSRT